MKHFFNDPLLIYNASGKDEYGRDSWGGGVAVSGRFVESGSTYKNAKGEVVVADALIHIPANTSIGVGSKVVFEGVSYEVAKIVKPKSISSIEFIKAFLTEMEE